MIINIDEVTMSYLEGLHFEYIGMSSLFRDILLINKDNPQYVQNKETCAYFMSEFRELTKKYEVMKQELISVHVPKEYQTEDYECRFNFPHSCIEVNLKSKGCACHV